MIDVYLRPKKRGGGKIEIFIFDETNDGIGLEAQFWLWPKSLIFPSLKHQKKKVKIWRVDFQKISQVSEDIMLDWKIDISKT